ncbi:MAG TPA: hypothetical protein VEK15_18800 [Vicinamibacteria bacterium]|nr:hypothetical protein [Vicinamibacteria bacterium]
MTLVAALLALLSFSEGERPAWSAGFGFRGVACSSAAIPDVVGAYYGIEMVPTRRVAGMGQARGLGKVSFSESPYGVAVLRDGRYAYDIDLSLERIKAPPAGFLTAWVAKSDLSERTWLGVLDDDLRVGARVEWNKFLLVVTLEPSDEPSDSWRGPVVLRGMSRSGLMHTLAGHGPFEKEPCSKYGFD